MFSADTATGGGWKRILILATLSALVMLFAVQTHRAASPSPQVGIFKGNSDVGVNPRAGSAAFDAVNQTYRITGGGANIWGNADAFHFVYNQVSGDMTITAGVAFAGTQGNEHRKAGIMFRQGLGADDAYADAVVHGVGLTALQYREKRGGQTLEIQASVNAPQFIRLERKGNRFTMYVAGADRQFTRVGAITIGLHDPVNAGLVVCSHDANDLQTAIFSQVEAEKGN